MTAGSIIVPTIIPLRAPDPSKPKSFVDTSTRIEIKSESQNVDIYYTMDGSKPQPFAALGTDKSTFKYRGPFTLPEGKVMVKAMGTSRDGIRESNINTKVFEVQYLHQEVRYVQEDDDKAFQKEIYKERPKHQRTVNRPYRRAWNEEVDQLEAHMTDMRVGGSNNRPAPSMARFTSTRFQPTSTYEEEDTERDIKRSNYKSPEQYSFRQTQKLQKQTDFLRCIYCYAERPSDPYAKYCGTCGNPVPPIPVSKLAPPEPGEMGVCVHCKSTVPLNTKNCVVCEASIPNQNQPQISRKLEQSKVCSFCGTGNPASLKTCILCEGTLPTKSQTVETREFAPPVPPTEGQMRDCSVCHRVNTMDARFCDWCGAKPSNSTASLTCSRCGSANNMYAEFCSTCGVSISAPQRLDLTRTNPADPPAYWSPAVKLNTTAPTTPEPIYLQPKKPATKTANTQTVGLFYPSERELRKKREQEEEKLSLEREMRDRKPLITSISPGKGYWRKQLEHMTTHLKAEAQTNPEFRSLIGDARMGKLTAVSVHEDGFELTLTASYSLRTQRDPYKAPPISGSKVLSDLTRRRRRFDSESEDSDEQSEEMESIVDRREKLKKTTTKKKSTKKVSKLSYEDRKLLKEVGKQGEGRPEEVNELITEGASPLVCSPSGVPALLLAVANKHIDCVDALLQSGADIGQQDKNGNTALHEAVNLNGAECKEIINILLSHGASLNVKNGKGQTPHDLAVRTGNEMATKLFMSNLGQNQLDKLTKSKPKSSKVNIF